MFFKRSDPLQFYQRIGGKNLVDAIQHAEKIRQRYDRRYGGRPRTEPPWQPLGAVRRWQQYDRGVRLTCEGGRVELHWVAPDCLRVRLHHDDSDWLPPFSYAVSKVDWPPVEFTVEESATGLTLRSPELVAHVIAGMFKLTVATTDGRQVYADTSGIAWRADGAVRLGLALQPDESGYGLGERALALNRRGQRVTLWNTEPPPQASRGTDPLHYSIPFYLGVTERVVRAIFWDNTSRGTVDVGATNPNEMAFSAERDELRYYIFAGGSVNNVLERYTELTGRIDLPPLWALGYHQARFSYFPQEAVLSLAVEFRRRSIPCDAIYLDSHYMHAFKNFTWDHERFPGAPQMVKLLHDSGFKVMLTLNPGIKIDDDYLLYKSGRARGIFLHYPDGELFSGALWPGASHLPDFTNPAARAWWAEQFDVLTRASIDGIVNDLSEPALFASDGSTDTPPDYVEHDRDGLGGNHLSSHNVYGMLMARATLDALHKHRPEQRQFNVVRSGFAGAQRYAASWTGDNHADWDQLRLSLSMTLSMGLSGAPLTGPNIGGSDSDPTPELFTRWLQAACLLPYFRNHTALGTKPQEPWSFGQPYEVINRVTISLRYRLLPYLYSMVALAREFGYPIVRPLFMAEPGNLALRDIDDAYLLGDALLVAPVLEPGALDRQVVLPSGYWYDYWTNDIYLGGQTITVPAPLERLPLFVRAGMVLPLWPEMQHVGEKPLDTITNRVYPGNADSVLYEDAGEGLAYRDGDYRWVYATTIWEDNKFVVRRRAAGRFQPPYRVVKAEIISRDEPVDVRIGLYGAPLWFYDEGILEVTTDDTAFGEIAVIYRGQPSDPTIASRPW